MTDRPGQLLLDEMFSPAIAHELRRRGYDVLALVADPELRTMSDPDVLAWAASTGRRVVTQNVKDFRPLLGETAGPGVLFTSSRTFPRSRHAVAPLLAALDAWLAGSAQTPRPAEDWLPGPATGREGPPSEP